MFEVLGMMAKYRTDLAACSCPGYWFRKDCKHHRAYREAIALVKDQDVFNMTWETGRGGNAAVRGSQCDVPKRHSSAAWERAPLPQVATVATWEEGG